MSRIFFVRVFGRAMQAGLILATASACADQGFQGRSKTVGPVASPAPDADVGRRAAEPPRTGDVRVEPSPSSEESGVLDALKTASSDATAPATALPTSGPVGLLIARTPPPPLPAPLVGEWQGFCGSWHNTPNVCEHGVASPMSSSGVCPAGLERVHVGARLQLGDNDARNEAWSAACLRGGAPSAEQGAKPLDFARAGGVYGLCVYTHNASSCDKEVRFPMRADKSCPAGFVFTHFGARYNGMNEHWAAACVAQADGPRVVRAKGAWTGLCAYSHNKTACEHASLGGISQRGQCPAGTSWRPFVARFNGYNEIWAGTCLATEGN
ncbi:MAG: hypothetical protein IOD12_10105 [Silvanigrellales bacterium]|nr:hypothetical protein [Silvanigrellales bacterium]